MVKLNICHKFKATKELVSMGYTRVYDFSGIID